MLTHAFWMHFLSMNMHSFQGADSLQQLIIIGTFWTFLLTMTAEIPILTTLLPGVTLYSYGKTLEDCQ